jgi:TolA-binding protein
MMKTIGMCLVATFFCSGARAQSSSEVDLHKKMVKLESEIKRLQAQNVELAHRFVASSHSGAPPEPLPESLSAEWLFYSKIIDSYQKKNGADLDRMVALFLKAYPQSVYADNALYLQAKWELASGEYQKSLNTLARLLSLYPDGDKAVSALYTKGVILSRMKQSSAAKETFHSLLALYPGSPESRLVLAQNSSKGTKK